MPPDILIVELGSARDILLTTPLVRVLRQRHPQAHLAYVAPADYRSLLEHNPRINRVISWRSDGPGGLRALAREISAAVRQHGSGAAKQPPGEVHRLDLDRSGRSLALRWLVGGRWTTYPRYRLARTVPVRWKRNWYRDQRPVAERYFDAARRLDVVPDEGPPELFLPRAAAEQAERFLVEQAVGPGRGRQLIAIAPGADQPTKRWPVHHWVALGRRLLDQGNDVLVVGVGADPAVAEGIVGTAESGGVASAGGRAAGADLLTTAALFKRCRALITGDDGRAGMLHLATAVGTPVLALFGPTVMRFGFGPYHAKATVLQLDLPCRPCSSDGGPACPLKHHRCLQDLQPGDVLAALRKLPR